MNKKSWYKWHSLAGIKLSILICFILVTGTLAVISHEIDWLANSSKRVLPAVDSSNVNWSAVYKAANAHQRTNSIQSIHSPIDDWFAVEVITVDEQGMRHREYYHPITGAYQGDGRWYNWQRFFRMAHRHLMMPTIYGTSIVGVMGLLMFFSLVSGFFMFPKWWKNFFRKPRTQNRKVFWNDCHRLFGLWSSWLLLVVCVTGVWYLAELWGLDADFPMQQDHIQMGQQDPIMPSQAVFDKTLARVKDYHDMQIKAVLMPSKRWNTLIFQGQNDTVLVRDRANNVIFNPLNGDYISRRYAQEQSLHVRISEAADPLHFGTFYGISSKIVYFIFGCVLSALAISGTYMYGLKLVRQHRELPIKPTYVWRQSWQGMHYGRWLSLLLIVICLILTIILFTNIVAL
ncbi:PepSY-associated TM helix domain-containing protein [Pseudoalteromonas sp. S16_S37]|uniref:PepSY-associated TM helix domain-containing protein n=1 Tax=Pseudoalteromonas sp. S16_S37 TaxID=2720228 RepID=UPI001680628F|nr:PepSY-associated TM helix domain-containing protein [Pseudoalteromonas sp. S16_S37]MBD1581647.1 PepSY domain-containing protein [Pseudoalteromonas sp. S16_S37]